MVSACLEAYRATSDAWWYEQAQRAFDWFLGWNDLGLELYSPSTGGCRDALARGPGQPEPGRRIDAGLPALAGGNAAHAKRRHRLQPARFVTPPSHENRHRPTHPRHPASGPHARAAPAVSPSERPARRQNLRPGHGPSRKPKSTRSGQQVQAEFGERHAKTRRVPPSAGSSRSAPACAPTRTSPRNGSCCSAPISPTSIRSKPRRCSIPPSCRTRTSRTCRPARCVSS